MKSVLSYALAAFASTALAAPTPVVKRQAGGPVGFASLNGGTTGGAGGPSVTVSDYAAFSEAATRDGPVTVYLDGAIHAEEDAIRVTSDTSIIGLNAESQLFGLGLLIKQVSNVIVQNIGIHNVHYGEGDAIGIDEAANVWIDHCDLSSDLDSGKDFYDGLIDITHAADFVTVSNTFLHDHWKASLVGHSDDNGSEDAGHLTVTYANNLWLNCNSRLPSVRFGQVHIYNNYYDGVGSNAINTRMGAQLLVESTAFVGADVAISSRDSPETGYATVNDLALNGAANDAPAGDWSAPYSYDLVGSANVYDAVWGTAGQTLAF